MTYSQSFLEMYGSTNTGDIFNFSSSVTRSPIDVVEINDLDSIRLIEPISLKIEYVEDECVTALSEDLDLWVDGQNLEQVIVNMKTQIKTLYTSLLKNENRLGPMPKKYLEFLRSKIDER